MKKQAYVCGPLTEFPENIDPTGVKLFYSQIGDLCGQIYDIRAFVPHEHYDPVEFPRFKDIQVYRAESNQIINNTSLLIMVNIAPTTGGGAEVALAADMKIPILFLCPEGKKISRYITGLAREKKVLMEIIYFSDFSDAIDRLRKALTSSAGLI